MVVALFGFVSLVLLAGLVYLGKDLVKEFAVGDQVFNFRLQEETKSQAPQGKLISKFAVLTDTHSDTEMTKKALAQAKSLGADYLIHTGDWSTVGTIEELNTQKDLFDRAGLPYWGVAGDHDLWQSGTENFKTVFGSLYESFDRGGVHHILMDASDTKFGFGTEQLNWLKADLKRGKGPVFIFMQLPPYHPFSSRTLWEKNGSNPAVKKEVDEFFQIIKGKVKAVFAGDHHFSASYTEPVSGVKIIVSGAVTSSRNLQEPRFNFVQVYDSCDFEVKEVVISK